MKLNSKIFILLLNLFIISFVFISEAHAVSCRDKYLDNFGQCASECSTLGKDYQADNAPGLCDFGLVCCHRTALELQTPIFDYTQAANLPEYMAKIYYYAMIVIVPLSIVMIIIGGFMWILAAGNQSNIAKAKGYIISAFIGLLLALFSYVFLSLVGIEILSMPGVQTTPAEIAQPLN